MIKKTTSLARMVLAATFAVLSLAAQTVQQWDFDDGNLAATAGGQPLQYLDAATQAGTAFGTATQLGIPIIGNEEPKVMRFGAFTSPSGYLFTSILPANQGGSLVNSWTLVMDLLYPAASDAKYRALIEIDGRLTPDSDMFIGPNNGLGVNGRYDGRIAPNQWHRIAVVFDGATSQIRKYINGELVGTQSGHAFDGRFSLSTAAELFNDDNAETAGGFVNSIQIRDQALSSGQVRALGGPTAAGIPRTIPPIPSGIEKWIPATSFASRTTPVGAVIAIGATTIQNTSITLKLNGVTQASPTITRDAEFITVTTAPLNLIPGTVYTNEITYTDSMAGAKTFTKTFTAAVFYEDFEGITLGPGLEEGHAADIGWTNRPPIGWSINNTNMAGFGGPDDDGDGRPDGDGRSEWFGWSFANKEWWVRADDQRRSEFALAVGTVAIADPDEWDDSPHDQGLFNSFLITPEISLAGLAANSAFLRFDSSWRPEAQDDGPPRFPEGNINNQTAIIRVSFDGAAPVQIMKWDSVSGSPTFHTDLPNETVLLPIPNPAGAQKMVITFAMVEAANDWWWAIDNIVVNAGAAPPVVTQNPTAFEKNEGDTGSLSVTSSGSGLTYQWFKGQGSGKVAVAGATSATLNFAALKVEDSGYYSVEVKNSVGTAVSGLAKVTVLPRTSGRLVLLDENFDSLVLGPNVDESLAGEQVWTKTGPAGWTIDDTGVPGAGTDGDGVTEWAGWSFATRTWWAQTAGDQQRTLFTKGTGTSAIADSDEWDDIGHDAGNMATILKTKNISLQGVKANSVILKFDSSWRPENPQKASVSVSFDGGAPIEILGYHSDPNNPNFRPDEVNETIALKINNPSSAQNMQIQFRYYDTRNNWWWAIDNILVLGDRAPLFAEDFESLVLGPKVDEALAGTNVWTSTPPTGWSVDNDGTPGLNDPAVGVREWEGWNFASRAWWAQAAGDQRRSEFLKGVGAIAIADGDEWDDRGSPSSLGRMNTFLKTRVIDISSAPANRLQLKFDSSWRDEPDQKVNITVSYNGAAAVEVLRWESVAGANFHDDAPNETVTVSLRNPAGATNMVLTFGYLDAGNNWWWAIDNIEVNVLDQVPVDPPVITSQPASLTVTAGETATFAVSATGTSLNYQWKLNGNAIAGATTATLSIDNAGSANAGPYTVTITNSAGAVTSAAATLTVNPIPVPAKLTDGLVAYLKFDNNYADASGNGVNGQAVGAPSFGAGKIGSGALVFTSKKDGSSFNYVTLGTNALLDFSTNIDFTISFWTKFTNWSGDPGFVANKDWNSGGNIGYVIATAGDGRLQWNYRVTGGATRKDYDGPAGTLSNGQWHHVLVSFQRKGVASTYLDGALVNTTPIGPSTGTSSPGLPVNIGQDGTGTYTDGGSVEINQGMIDDVAIWRRIVVPTEVNQIYTRGSTGEGLDTVAGPKFETIADLGNAVRLSWTGGNAPYLVQRKASLSQANWDSIATTSNQSILVAKEGATAFYRLVSGTTNVVAQFTVNLSGANERPAVTSSGTGSGTVTIDGDTIRFNVAYSGLSAAANNAHFHGPTNTLGSTGVLLGLNSFNGGAFGTSGTLSGSTALAANVKTAMLAGLTYLNIHSTANTGGEVRGQVAPMHLSASLNGANEKPTPVTTPGLGRGIFLLNGNQLTYDIQYSGLTSAATAAHIHGRAGINDPAGVLFALQAAPGTQLGISGRLSGSVTLSADQFAAIVDGQTYVNIHTANNGGGEIRGQVLP